MINNLELIKSLLTFKEEGDFYALSILKRKKDQPDGEKDNVQSVRTIKTYSIGSIEYLEKRYEEIMMLSEVFKARVYIQVQRQNHKDVGLNMISEIATKLANGNFIQKNIFDSVVGKLKTLEKRWIVDIDDNTISFRDEVITFINSLDPQDETNKVEAIIPTRNGFHLITKRFNTMEFSKKYGNIDIQKKNPTLLYYPNSLG